MKLFIFSMVLVNFLGSVLTKSVQVNDKQEQEQQQQQQQQQQQRPPPQQQQQPQKPLIPQVVRSVNPSPATDKQQRTAAIQGLGALLAQQRPMDSRQLAWATAEATGGSVATAGGDNNEQLQLQHQSTPSTTTTTTTEMHHDKKVSVAERQPSAAKRQEDVMNLLLQELPTLDIEALNGAALKGGEINPVAARLRQQQIQQSQQGVATGATESTNALIAAGNRLRGRSAFLMGANGAAAVASANHQVAPSFQISAASLGLDGGVNGGGYPKRVANNNNRHVPCFFNAITCF